MFLTLPGPPGPSTLNRAAPGGAQDLSAGWRWINKWSKWAFNSRTSLGPVSPVLPALLGGRESVLSVTLTHQGCCSVSGVWHISKNATERKVLLLERPTSVAETAGVGGRGGWTGSFPAAQISPHKQSLGPSLPFLLWTLRKCGGWRSHHAIFHLCSAALSYQK